MSTPVLNLPSDSQPPPPPKPPALSSLDTPSHQRTASYTPYSSINGLYQQTAYVHAALELDNKYISASAKALVDFYFPENPDIGPPPQVDYTALTKIATYKIENSMYDQLIEAVKPAVQASWHFVNTSAHVDPDSKFILNTPVKPDITLYGSGPPSNENICRSCDAELFLELKTDLADDPFEDTDNGVVPRQSARGRDTRGQVITYLNAMQASQLRTHSFGVIIIAKYCRLFRLTRSTMEVTERFDYTTSPILIQFLWRLSHAAPEVRGLDTTFEKVAIGSELEARKLIDAVDKAMWKVFVDGRSFFVAAPFTRSHHLPVGRGTRCFVAVDTETNQRCLLKDTWRVIGYHPEGEAYARLKEHQVQNVPNVVAAGDVPGHKSGDFHSYPLDWIKVKEEAIREHQHYRLVLDVIGRPLIEFTSTHELVKCVLDVLQAHSDAWTKARVEHRDVSIGNIIILVKDATTTGLLIDWELARFDTDSAAQAYERIGTRQFMSARLFTSLPPARELADDLESFLLVLLWVAITYAPNGMTPDQRADELKVFDGVNQAAKRRLITSGRSSVYYFFLQSAHFELLLGELLDGFKDRYFIPAPFDSVRSVSTTHLESHNWMIQKIRTALDDEFWKTFKDTGASQEVAKRDPPGLQRKSDLPEYAEMVS
ncbi:hypothetical protein B0H19DRAFT_1146710 [Mycena capillaripes]|nr:hypothetical protein B0H19DRAFT_1146710 [Mycena capillaripes]